MTPLRSLSIGAHFMTAASHRFGKVRSVKGIKYGCGVRVLLENEDGTTANRVLAPDTKVYPLPSLGSVVVRAEGEAPKRDVYEPEWAPVHCAIPAGRF